MKISRLLTLAFVLMFAVGANAKDFIFKDMQGKVLRLSDYRGKWVLVNFWATWCGPCQQETPDLVSLYNARNKTDFAVIGVALDSKPRDVTKFAAQYAISYPLVIGSYTMAENQVGNVEALPTSYLYDPTGKLVSFQEGMVTSKEIELYILLKSKKGAPQ